MGGAVILNKPPGRGIKAAGAEVHHSALDVLAPLGREREGGMRAFALRPHGLKCSIESRRQGVSLSLTRYSASIILSLRSLSCPQAVGASLPFLTCRRLPRAP